MNPIQMLTGLWLGMLLIPGTHLPFIFEIKEEQGKFQMIIRNAEERIICDDIRTVNDSLTIRFPLFNSEFRLSSDNDTVAGRWINYGRKDSASIPFTAYYGNKNRFEITAPAIPDLSGKWETYFGEDTIPSVGIFKQTGHHVSGTFLSETGDHRWLEGIASGDSLKLSTFDGAHAWLYLAQIKNDSITGNYYSGAHYKTSLRSIRNPDIKLRHPDSITYVDGEINFNLPLIPDGRLFSLNNDEIKGKVVILQIMGSWCPNCMDETEFLSGLYNKYKSSGLEIIGITFERNDNMETVNANISRIRKKYNISYPIVFGGTTGQGKVESALPFLKNFISYPTSVTLNKNGKVARVHSGFSGPATGEVYNAFTIDFEKNIVNLLR